MRSCMPAASGPRIEQSPSNGLAYLSLTVRDKQESHMPLFDRQIGKADGFLFKKDGGLINGRAEELFHCKSGKTGFHP